ncbi:MAG: hypothetical protein V4548_02060 [Bacteroidota bacterium]
MNLFQEIIEAKSQLNGVVTTTPLAKNSNISDEFEATVFLKREDLQTVRSYKIRGAYNKIRVTIYNFTVNKFVSL